jgi:uncharacterized protein YbjT (DUF2867 family)
MVRIAVVGSTGRVGSCVWKELSKDTTVEVLALGRQQNVGTEGVTIQCLTSSTIPPSIITIPAAQYRYADLLQPDTLVSALEGIDRVFLITPDDDLPNVQIQMEGNLIRAAKTAGVQHVVKLSAYLAGHEPKPLSFGIAHRECEALLERSGLTYTHLRPTVFMQTIASCVDGTMLIAPAKHGKVAFVDIADIARVAAVVLIKGGYENQILRLTGPSAHSFSEVAAVLSEHVNGNIAHVAPPSWLARLVIPFKAGVSFNFANRLVDLMVSLDQGSEAQVHDSVKEVTGKAPVRLENHMAQHWRDYCSPG